MSELPRFASLTSTLLARKGQARPAMRPQGFEVARPAPAVYGGDDLGWNDMGDDRALPALVPEAPAPADGPVPLSHVLRQQEAIARAFEEQQAAEAAADQRPEPIEPPAPVALAAAPQRAQLRAAPGTKSKTAFTLRLDRDRHLRLRLACAVRQRSAQLLVTEALDALLDAMPELDRLAAGDGCESRH